MTREIKFRAWDKKYSRMNYKVQVGNTDYADQNYTCNSIWVDYGDSNTVGWMNADDKCIDLMQFTGIKDMDGKDIYEGDFLNIGNLQLGYFQNREGENVKYEVKFVGCEFTLFRNDIQLNWGRLSRIEELGYQCKLNGNIYEK
jgi:uncharacterized phage protein (TIGR01671 family)